jgi:hypothetical protein
MLMSVFIDFIMESGGYCCLKHQLPENGGGAK